jgi:hypothetical protein
MRTFTKNTALSEHGMCELTARHDGGMAGAWHGHGMLCMNWPIGRPEMLVCKYRSTLCNISEELCLALHGLVQSNLVDCGSVLHTWILR